MPLLKIAMAGCFALGMALLGCLSSGSVLTAEALAGSGCGPNAGDEHNFVGYTTPPDTSNFGAKARIQFQNPALCGPDVGGGSASTAWAMVEAHSAEFPSDDKVTGYAQAGYGQFGYSGIDISTFTEWTSKCFVHKSCNGAQATHDQFDPVNPTNSYVYRAYYSSADGFIHMQAGAGASDVTTYNPSGDWVSAWRSEYEGETLDTETDAVGVSNDRALFDELKRYTVGGNWAYHTSFQSTSSISRYHKSAIGGTDSTGHTFVIWTDPL